MQSKGLDFLKPIWAMIYSDEGLVDRSWDDKNKKTVWKLYGLNLSENDVEVTYTRYTNTIKPPQNPKSTDKTAQEAVEAGLTPGNNFQKIKKSLKIYFSRKCNLQRSPAHHGA